MIKCVANSIEDLLEILAGLQGQGKMQIKPSDATIMHSIARQTFKGTAMTDRQAALMKEKLQSYKDQFTALEYDFDGAINNLRKPLRHIDRSKYIKIISHLDMVGPDQVYESYKQDWKWISVRFPFSKKLIMKINSISSIRDYYHEKGSHVHNFRFTEKNVLAVMKQFSNSEFEIDKEIIDYHDKVKDVLDHKNNFVPAIRNIKLSCVNDKGIKLAANEIGELDKDTLIKYVDRKRRYGIIDVEVDSLTGDLSEQIALRSSEDILLKPSIYRMENVFEAIDFLDRYPMLIVLDEDLAETQLHNCYKFYKDFLPSSEQSVLFRLDSNKNSEFNQLVKDYKLNNWVDKNTKIVYISANKLPKLLLSGEWKPITSFLFNTRVQRNVDLYLKEFSDLIIFYDEDVSPFRKYSNYYGKL